MSIEGEALDVGLALCVGLAEELELGDSLDELAAVGDGVGFGSSSAPLQPAKASVAAVAKPTAYAVVVRDFIGRDPSLVQCLAAHHGRAKHRNLPSRVENPATFASPARPRTRSRRRQPDGSARSATWRS
jgi:hypothetical protein